MSDLRNLEPRKILRRGGASVPHVTTSGMGSRATGDGATGRPPAETPQSVGMAPFADGRPRSISASLPAEFGARCLPASPRSAHLVGDVPCGRGLQDGGSTRQAQSAGPVLSTPAPGPLCGAETTSPRKRPRLADAEAGGEDSAMNGADSSAQQLTGGDVTVYSGAVATSVSMHQPLLDLSVGPEPRECPPVVCQEGSYVIGPSPRAAESLQFPRKPSPAPRRPSGMSPVENIIAEVPPEAPAASAGTSEVGKPKFSGQAVKDETDHTAAQPQQGSVHDIVWRHDVGGSQRPQDAAEHHSPPKASAGNPEDEQAGSVQLRDHSMPVAQVDEQAILEAAQQDQRVPRNGVAAAAPRASPENGVSLATQYEETHDVGGSVNGEDDAEAEAPAAEAAVKRPRRAARARKTAQELVNGEAARGVGPQRSTERSASRGAEGGPRNSSSQKYVICSAALSVCTRYCASN